MDIKDIFLVVVAGNIITFGLFIFGFSISVLVGTLFLCDLCLCIFIYLELSERVERRKIENAKKS